MKPVVVGVGKTRRSVVKRAVRSVLKKKLDELFSLFIRKRDGECLRCGKKTHLQCSHVMPRTWIATRWLPLNAITLCYSCHLHWWHKNPLEAAQWFEEKWPGRFAQIQAIALTHVAPDLEAVWRELNG